MKCLRRSGGDGDAALALVREGLLEICPQQGYQQAVLLSAGIHGNETAPIELLNQLVGDVLRGVRALTVRLLVVLGNPAAMRADRRYLHADMNRMFGGRYRDFPASGETARAQQLEQLATNFFSMKRQSASITICIPPSANHACRALAFYRSRRVVIIRSCWPGWMRQSWTRWWFTGRRAAPSATLPASTWRRPAVRWS